MNRTIIAACALTLAFGSASRADIIWSSSFESYSENAPIITNNTTGALDTFSVYFDGSDLAAPLVARMPSGGVQLATGLAANVSRGVSTTNGAIHFERNNLPDVNDGGVMVISFDLQQRQWSSNQLLRAYAGNTNAGSFAVAGNFGNDAMRSFWVINRTGAPIDLPHNLRETPPGPDNVNDDTYTGFSRRSNGTVFNHPTLSADISLSPISSGAPINRFAYNDNGSGQTAARDHWFDNFIVTDSVDDAFIGPDGVWRSALDLTVGTRPTSAFLGSGAAPTFSGSVINGVNFTPSLASSGMVEVNGPILDVANTDAGWISFNKTANPFSNETVVLLDLESTSGPGFLSYVVNELEADATLRNYVLSANHELLELAQFDDFDVALSFADLAPGTFHFSLRLGGDGSVFLDQIAIVSPVPVPEPSALALTVFALAGLVARRSRLRRD